MPKPNSPRIGFGSGNGRQSNVPNYSGGGGTFAPRLPAAPATPSAPPSGSPNPYQLPAWTPYWTPSNWGTPMNLGPMNPTAPVAPELPNTPAAGGTNIPWSPWQERMGTNMNTHGYGGLNRQLTPWEQLTGQRRASGWRPGAMSPGGSGAGSWGSIRGSINDLPQRWGWNNPQPQGQPAQQQNSGYNPQQWSNGLVNWSI